MRDAKLKKMETSKPGRPRVWTAYPPARPDGARRNDVRLMAVPEDRTHTAHLYYLRTPTERQRDDLIAHLAARGISAPFHYVPLDSSPAGLKLCRTPRPCVRSADFSGPVVRLPLWPDLTDDQITRVLDAATAYTV